MNAWTSTILFPAFVELFSAPEYPVLHSNTRRCFSVLCSQMVTLNQTIQSQKGVPGLCFAHQRFRLLLEDIHGHHYRKDHPSSAHQGLRIILGNIPGRHYQINHLPHASQKFRTRLNLILSSTRAQAWPKSSRKRHLNTRPRSLLPALLRLGQRLWSTTIGPGPLGIGLQQQVMCQDSKIACPQFLKLIYHSMENRCFRSQSRRTQCPEHVLEVLVRPGR
jgi:hypothetical protein